VIFDRSWYDRAGVEYVMGIHSKAEHQRYLKVCPGFEAYAADGGIVLVRFWPEVSDAEPKRRFEAPIHDRLPQRKPSPTGRCSRSRWFEYSRAPDVMLEATDAEYAPRYIVPSDAKRRAPQRIAHLLGLVPYEKLPRKKVQLPERSTRGACDDQATPQGRRFVKPKF
jgi:polyphosphate kinase 2 (PPK2 family)